MLRLNLGCGSDIKEGFVNIDIRELPGVDLVADVRILSTILDDSVDEINAYDVLEHFSFRDTTTVLKCWIAKLKVGGKIIIRVPDIQKILIKLVDGTLPAFEAQRLIFGGQDYPENFHCAGFTEGVLEGMLRGCGCSEIIQVVREENSHNVTLVARK